MATTPAQSPQGVVREARRLLSERGWNPLAGAFDANGDECSPSDPNAVSYSAIGAVYAVIWPRERLLTGQDSDRVIPADYVLRLLSHAIPQAPGTQKTEPCRNQPRLDIAWMMLENYEQTDGRTLDEVTGLFDRAVELENSLESQYGRVEPMPLARPIKGAAGRPSRPCPPRTYRRTTATRDTKDLRNLGAGTVPANAGTPAPHTRGITRTTPYTP